jgi:hypothetical protein
LGEKEAIGGCAPSLKPFNAVKTNQSRLNPQLHL